MTLDRRSFLAALGSASLVDLTASMGQRPAPAGAAVADVDHWRALFPALAQSVNGRPLAYLDNAATTLRPRAVIDAVAGFYATDNANPSPRLHALARRSAEKYGAARTTVARFVNARDAAEIVFTRGTTEGINLVAATWGREHVTRGDEIVLTVAEHASNLMPWQRLATEAGATLRIVGVNDDGTVPMAELAGAVSPRTRLVAVSHVSNVLGTINPIAELCAAVRARAPRELRVLVDAAQSAPHVPLDVQRFGCDFLAFSSHKMLGPMGVGVLWARRELLDAMPPYHTGSNMAHAVEFDGAELEHGAAKFQAGTPNVSGPVGLAAAIQQIEAIGWDALRAHDHQLTAHALARFAEIDGLRVIGSRQPADRVPVFAFALDGVPVPDIVRALDAEGIAVRGGDLAALPLLKRFGVAEAARVSLYLYNTTDEIDRCARVLRGLRR